MKKKATVILMTAVLLVSLVPTAALAHGHRSASRTTTAVSYYQLCSVTDCTNPYTHQHNHVWYYGHSLNDGHDYHTLCSVQGCTQTVVHMHNDQICYPHTAGDGHGYHYSRHGGKAHH